MKLLSLFSGIGAFEKAMKNQDIPFELVGYSEIDKYAAKSYSEVHGVPESMNLGDIQKIDETSLPQVDFITYGFPCQDISKAGHTKGFFDDTGKKTRSGLFFDALRIIKYCQPKVAIAENVKNLVGKTFKEEFEIVLQSLDEAGYNNYWKVLKASDFGVPQKRERVFIVSIRKDVDHQVFQFPEPFPLDCCLEDYLEKDVDEKFFLSNEQVQKFLNSNYHLEQDRIQDIGGVCNSLRARDYKSPLCVRIGNIYNDSYGGSYAGNVYAKEGIAPALTTAQGGGRQLMIVDNQRVRKLSPVEYWKLMGFDREDALKCSCSNTQLYKQAGNSIVVDVCEEILCNLFDEDGNFFI